VAGHADAVDRVERASTAPKPKQGRREGRGACREQGREEGLFLAGSCMACGATSQKLLWGTEDFVTDPVRNAPEYAPGRGVRMRRVDADAGADADADAGWCEGCTGGEVQVGTQRCRSTCVHDGEAKAGATPTRLGERDGGGGGAHPMGAKVAPARHITAHGTWRAVRRAAADVR
jgi:hypothetical protein